MTQVPSVPRLRSGFDRLGVRLALVLAVALLPLMIVSILRSQSVVNEAEARSKAALVGETLRAVRDTVSLIERARSTARTLGVLALDMIDEPDLCNKIMRDTIRDTPFSFAGFYELDGYVPCSSAPAPFSFGMTPALAGQIANPVPTVLVNEDAPASKTSVIYASYPVFATNGDLMGFAAVSVPHTMLQANDDAIVGAEFLTVKADETILTAPGDLADAYDLLPIRDPRQSIMELPESFVGWGRDGEERVYAVTPIIDNDLFAIGTWAANDEIRDQFYLTNPALFPVLMWLASLAVAWFASRLFVTQHVVQLRYAMRDFSGNRRQTDIDAFAMAPSELRDVAAEFVGMTDRIMHEEARLEDTARQKDVLLREVHHRVKNNLQLIASIMSMQMRQSRSPEVKRLIRSLHDRVNSLATIHRELYQTSGQADVSMDELLKSIVTQVVRMGAKQGEIELKTDFEPMRLNPDQAVPLSLFVTEALTNALKYIGASDGKKATLRVHLKRISDSAALVEVSNSLPATIVAPDADKSSGLGSELMEAFGEQLEGVLDRGLEGGSFVVRLQFPIEKLAAKDPEM